MARMRKKKNLLPRLERAGVYLIPDPAALRGNWRGALGLPLFFLTKSHIGTSAAAILMVMIMVPFLLLAMFERNGRPFEKIARDMINVLFRRPKQRPYRTRNFYSMLEKQDQFNREVRQIVSGNHQSAAKTDR